MSQHPLDQDTTLGGLLPPLPRFMRREVSALERKPRSRYGRNLWLAIGAGLRLGLPLDFKPSPGAIAFAAVLLALVLAVAYVALTA